MDYQLRQLERLAQQGDQQAQERYNRLRERLHLPRITAKDIEETLLTLCSECNYPTDDYTCKRCTTPTEYRYHLVGIAQWLCRCLLVGIGYHYIRHVQIQADKLKKWRMTSSGLPIQTAATKSTI